MEKLPLDGECGFIFSKAEPTPLSRPAGTCEGPLPLVSQRRLDLAEAGGAGATRGMNPQPAACFPFSDVEHGRGDERSGTVGWWKLV